MYVLCPRLAEILTAAKPGEPIQKVLSPHCGESLGGRGGEGRGGEGRGGEGRGGEGVVCSAALFSVEYNPALIGHCLAEAGFEAGVKLGKGFKPDEGNNGDMSGSK